ncbi:HmuY family protein [Flavobacterium sp. CYK-55]|uniref:HmuY family protein n=1 Tax=Flavobacterium sp. CYK-55 TaxID=2835529 RepID=UPI001BCD3B43|nr:HmuY family protein [Flavobacterium sp. CYK-55]MBS7788167.1 HmuY family protein [Flavobacterium sp. CYK-55]
MRTSNILKSAIAIIAIGLLSACSNDNNDTTTKATLETKTFSNLYAPQTGGQGQPVGGAFTKFSFSQNTTVTDDTWDIAFRGTTLLVNGGSEIGITDEPTRTGSGSISIVSNTLSAVTTLPSESSFNQDGAGSYAIPTGSGNGWYNYNSTNNLITPIAGKIFVIKTHDGKYAKMEIISYYKDAPANPDTTSLSRYYTFKYVYQPNGNGF